MPRSARRSAAGLAVAAAITLSGCAAAGGDQDAPSSPSVPAAAGDVDWSTVEPVELTVSSAFTQGVTSHDMLMEWMDAVTDVSEGRITFDLYEAGVLHSIPEALSAVSTGLTDVTFVINSQYPEQLPVSYWRELVIQDVSSDFGYPNTNAAGLALAVTNSVLADEVVAESMTNGHRVLMPNFVGPAVLQCTEPFDSLADLEGRQSRVPNAVAQAQIEALGMTGVFMPTSEQYEALSRGVLDCTINNATLVPELIDVAPYMAVPNFAPTAANWAISASAWEQFSPAVQQVLLDLRADPYVTFAKASLQDYAELPDAAEAAGGAFVDSSELNEALADWRSTRKSLAETAPAQIDDPAAEIAKAKEQAQAWWDYTVNVLNVPVDADTTDTMRLGGDILDWSAWQEALVDGNPTVASE